MSDREKKITADRLFEASEAVLSAVREIIQTSVGSKARAPYPPDLMGNAAQPSCLQDFTRSEVEEATAFLIRLGILQLPGAAK